MSPDGTVPTVRISGPLGVNGTFMQVEVSHVQLTYWSETKIVRFFEGIAAVIAAARPLPAQSEREEEQ